MECIPSWLSGMIPEWNCKKFNLILNLNLFKVWFKAIKGWAL